MVENTIVTLFERGMSFTEWEDTFEEATGGISDRGYIAGIHGQSLVEPIALFW